MTRLEVVEVEVQDGGRPAAAAGPGQGVTEPVEEERSVRQPGQDVVERLVAELLLERLPLGDVAVVDDDAADGRVVEQVLGDRLEASATSHRRGGPGTRPSPPSRWSAATSASSRSTVARSSGWTSAVAGRPMPVLGATTQDALDRRALVADRAVLAEDDDAVRRVLDERPEPLLAALEVDEQQPLGRRLLLESAVLARQDARRAAERQPDEQRPRRLEATTATTKTPDRVASIRCSMRRASW